MFENEDQWHEYRVGAVDVVDAVDCANCNWNDCQRMRWKQC